MGRGDRTKPEGGGKEPARTAPAHDELRRTEKPEPAVPEFPSEPEPWRGSPDETRVVLLPVDPYLVHVYWELASRDLEEAQKRLSELGRHGQQPQAVLKFYDVTRLIFDGTNAHASFEVNIELGAGNWYVHLWSPEKSYCVDLGFRTGEGGFLPIARSNVAETPRAWPSVRTEQTFTLEGACQRVESVRSAMEPEEIPPLSTPTPDEERDEPPPIQLAEVEMEIGTTKTPSLAPASETARAPAQSKQGRRLDLAGMSEKQFVCGLSSRRMEVPAATPEPQPEVKSDDGTGRRSG